MEPEKKRHPFWDGFIGGIGWSFGATVGFAIISTILVLILRQLGGLPVIGDWLASVVQATTEALIKRTPILPN